MAKEGLFDRMVQHQVGLERAKAGEIKRIKSILAKVDNDVDALVLNLPTNYTKRQLDALINKIRKTNTAFYATTVQKALNEIAETVVSLETEFSYVTVRDYLEGNKTPKKPNPIGTLRRVQSETYQGHRLATWNKKLARDKNVRIERQLRTISVDNGSPEELARGARAAMRVSNNNSQSITRAYFDQSSNMSRDDVYLQNDDFVKEIIWSSILDSGTTITCGVRSNKRYDAVTKEPIEHDNDWGGGPGAIHFGCRSVGIPVDESEIITSGSGAGFKFSDGTKTAIGPEEGYDRGDNKNEQGKRYKIPTRNNFLEKQLVGADTNYETWLRRQPKAFVQDSIGVNKAERFLNGKEPLSSFVVPDGTELTVKQLNQRLGMI